MNSPRFKVGDIVKPLVKRREDFTGQVMDIRDGYYIILWSDYSDEEYYYIKSMDEVFVKITKLEQALK